MNLNKKAGKNRLYEELIADGEVQRVSLDLVDRDENQPRSLEEVKKAANDLQPSIAINGIVQMPVYWAREDGRFLIIVGECRTEGARLNGDEEIAAVIKTFDSSDDAKKQIAEIRYAENDPKTRKNLTPLDEAKFWFNYIEEFYIDENGKPQVKKAAEHLGQDQTKISHFLGIHRASDSVKALIKKRNITDYQLAYIMARMEKHKGLVDEFIAKCDSVDFKGGIQSLANKMLKQANDKNHKEKVSETTLDLKLKTAEQVAKERQEKLDKDAKEKQFEEEMQAALEQEKDDRNAAAAEEETTDPGKSLFADSDAEQENQDPLFEKAAEHVRKENKVSISMLQRYFQVGYNRAARIVEQLEAAGIVTELSENGGREVLQPGQEKKPEPPANIGTVCLKFNKNTAVVSTIANQPATLTKEQAAAVIKVLKKWVYSDEK